jgi:hypothetical protein
MNSIRQRHIKCFIIHINSIIFRYDPLVNLGKVCSNKIYYLLQAKKSI